MRERSRRGAFTIVEMLVVIGILGLLVGLLVPALSGVRKRMHKAEEVSNLRQVGAAWAMYATHNDEAILPGYLSVDTQAAWRAKYRDRDGLPILPAPDYEPAPDETTNVAGPWPWRLMSYLDYNEAVVCGHRDADEWAALPREERAWEIRERPAFGYNGIFVGGWWFAPGQVWCDDAEVAETEHSAAVISRSLASIRRSSQLLIFAASALRQPGLYRHQDHRDDELASFMVMPPIFRNYELWGIPHTLEVADGEGGSRMAARLGGDIFSLEYYGDSDWDDGVIPAS